MNDSETRINRDDVIADLDAQIEHTTAALKGKRGNVRRRLVSWRSALEDARRSVVEGMTTEAQVGALVRQGCRLAGAVRRRGSGRMATTRSGSPPGKPWRAT